MNKKIFMGMFRFFIAITAAYFFAGTAVLFADDYDLPPSAIITVDGNDSDWRGTVWTGNVPVSNDSTGDSLAPQYDGTDIKTVYVAADSSREFLYFRMDLTTNPNTDDCVGCETPGNGLIQYAVAFDDPSVLSFGTWSYDWQVGFHNGGFWVWDLRGQKDYDNTDNRTFYRFDQTSAAFAVGNVVEFAVPLDAIGNPFKVAAHVYLIADDGSYTNVDSVDSPINLRTFPLFADAGEDRNVDEGEQIVLDGSESSVTGDEITSYSWHQTSGSTIFLMDNNTASASFAAPYLEESGITLTFRLSVETLGGIQDQDEITVYVYDDPESEKFPEYWDEDDYLAANPDVAAVVSLKGFSSGYEHYMMYGRFEGRRGGFSIYDYPDYWDESAYLNENSDVSNAVFNHFFNNGYEHYFLYGEVEGRIARMSSDLPAYWDDTAYLAANADVANAVQGGWFSNGFEHYMNWGRYEGRRGGFSRTYPDFWDEHGYLTINGDVVSAVESGFFASAYEHYVLYGEAEGRTGGF